MDLLAAYLVQYGAEAARESSMPNQTAVPYATVVRGPTGKGEVVQTPRRSLAEPSLLSCLPSTALILGPGYRHPRPLYRKMHLMQKTSSSSHPQVRQHGALAEQDSGHWMSKKAVGMECH